MSTSAKIRPATLADVGAITALMQELHREEGYATLAEEGALTQALFAEHREVKFGAWVAEREGSIIAALLYYPGYDTLSASYGFHLADIIVTAEHRTQGVGRALMQALAEQTLREGKEWVSLTMLKNNNKARLFYASLGMSQVEVDFFAIGKTALAQM